MICLHTKMYDKGNSVYSQISGPIFVQEIRVTFPFLGIRWLYLSYTCPCIIYGPHVIVLKFTANHARRQKILYYYVIYYTP